MSRSFCKFVLASSSCVRTSTISLSEPVSAYEQVQVLSISQSDLRPTSDILLSSELFARGLKSYFKGLQSTK